MPLPSDRIVIGRIRPRAGRPARRVIDASYAAVGGHAPVDQTGLALKVKPSEKLTKKLDDLQWNIRTALIVAGLLAAFGLGALAVSWWMSSRKTVARGTRYRPRARRNRD